MAPLGRRLHRLASRPWLPYLMLLLLQAKVMWYGLGSRDLVLADEAQYYNAAYLWFQHFRLDPVWYPLYTAYLGTLLNVSTDAYVVTVLHRVLVVLALDVLVLALMRRLLPHWIAWLVAAWWVILPTNFDALFTIHLFAAIPVLASWLLILYRPRPWARGGALAIMLLATALTRNEYLVGALTLGAVCLWWELRMAGRLEPPAGRWSYAVGYGLPILLAALAIAGVAARSIYRPPELWAEARSKHVRNLCMTYAFGYQQRHPEWTKSPWLDCSDLMEQRFGAPLPTLTGMIRGNPRALLEHFRWNAGLTPTGIQVLLFNVSSARVDPGYGDIRRRPVRANRLSALVAGIATIGLFLIWRERRYWWERWLATRALGWLAMLSMIPVAVVVILTQRPRPAYLFAQGLFLMALTGMSAFAIVRRWDPPQRLLSAGLPLVMIALLVLVPGGPYIHRDPRSLLALYRRLAPFQDAFTQPGTIFLLPGYLLEIQGYVAHEYLKDPFSNRDYRILDSRPAGLPLGEFLDRQGVNLFYVDEALWARLEADPATAPFLDTPDASGWEVLVRHRSEGGTWMLLRRRA
ncbi:MAG TPA: hypothetical protein VEL75_15995 [Candidatus Methylomirabilis sp.]|nr:hypothetical protein [Candidatus Methylomirabilis sp.]